MTLLAFGMLVFLTIVILTAAIGDILDLPSLQVLRRKLSQRKMRSLALLVAASPGLTVLIDLPGRLTAASPMNIAFAYQLSMIGSAFFSAALAGCWLAMDEGGGGHVRPPQAIAMSCVLLVFHVLLIPVLRNWGN